jgi:hypothetical protein
VGALVRKDRREGIAVVGTIPDCGALVGKSVAGVMVGKTITFGALLTTDKLSTVGALDILGASAIGGTLGDVLSRRLDIGTFDVVIVGIDGKDIGTAIDGASVAGTFSGKGDNETGISLLIVGGEFP